MPAPPLQSRLLPRTSILGPKIARQVWDLGRGEQPGDLSPGDPTDSAVETPIAHLAYRPGQAPKQPVPIDAQLPRLTHLAPSPHHPSPITHVPHHASISEAYSSGIQPSNHGSVPLDTTHRPHLPRVSGTVRRAGRASPPSLLPVSARGPGRVSFIDDPNDRAPAAAPALSRPWNPGQWDPVLALAHQVAWWQLSPSPSPGSRMPVSISRCVLDFDAQYLMFGGGRRSSRGNLRVNDQPSPATTCMPAR